MLIVPWTIILSNTKGVNEYSNLFDKYTDIKYFIIDSYDSLNNLEEILISKKYTDINVILIRQRILSNDDLEFVPPSSIVKEFRLITEGMKFKRFVVDNFNDIKLTFTSNDSFIPADFTWLIGSSPRKTTGVIKHIIGSNIEKYFKDDYYNNPILQICNDKNIQRFYTIGFDSNFLKRYYSLPIVNSYYIRIQNKNNIYKFNNVLQDSLTVLIKDSKISELANELGISCESIENLHYILLESAKIDNKKVIGSGSSSDEYINIINSLNIIKNIKSNDLLDPKHNSIMIKNLFNTMNPLKVPKKVPQKVKSDKVLSVCSKIETELFEKKTKLLHPYQRFNDNLNDKECQCCYVPFEDLDNHMFILHCCQILICVDCLFIKQSKLISKCPKCTTIIKSINNISYINFNTESNSISQQNTSEIQLNNLSYNTIISKDPKIKSLIDLLIGTPQLIQTDPIEAIRWIYKDISSFGSRDSPSAINHILIYTNKESYDFINKELLFHKHTLLNNIKFQITYNIKNIINPLQITKIIFTNTVNLSEKQRVLNCIQTIGREYNLSIYRLIH